MISYETVVAEIVKHVAQAQNVRDEAKLREELSAIRALCDVALHNGTSKSVSINSSLKVNTTAVNSLPQQPTVQVPQSIATNKLQEEDANGDSIFDF